MSLLAGFDFGIDLSNDLLRFQVKTQLLKNNLPVSGPVEMPSIPFSAEGVTGNVYVVLTSCPFDFFEKDNDPFFTLSVHYNKMEISSNNVPFLGPLSGTFKVEAKIELIDGTDNNGAPTKTPGIDLKKANITHVFDDSSLALINSVLPDKAQKISDSFQSTFQSLFFSPAQGSTILFGQGLSVTNSGNGSLSPLVFTRVELKVIEGSAKGIALLGNLTALTKTKGNLNLKTSLTIAPFSQIGVHMSPGTFHNFIFCPGVASALQLTGANQLPPSCGGQTVKITKVDFALKDINIYLSELTDTFATDQILLSGHVKGDGPCFTFEAPLQGHIFFPDGITPTVKFDDGDIDIDTDFWCKLIGGLIGIFTGGGFFGAAFGFFGLDIAAAIVEGIGDNFLAKLSGTSLTLPGGNVLASVNPLGKAKLKPPVQITPEGLLTSFTVSTFLPSPSPEPSFLVIEGDFTDTNSAIVQSGTDTFDTGCAKTAYPYTITKVYQSGTFHLESHLISKPYKSVTWSIRVPNPGNTSAKEYPLPPDKKSVHISVESSQPTSKTTIKTMIDAEIDYSISGDTITLTNAKPENGNYEFGLYVNVEEIGGTNTEANTNLQFTGLRLDIGGTFQSDYDKCRDMWNYIVKHHKYPQYKPNTDGNPYEVIIRSQPGPDDLNIFLNVLKDYNTKESSAIYSSSLFANRGFADKSRLRVSEQNLFLANQSNAALQRRISTAKGALDGAIQDMTIAEEKLNLAKSDVAAKEAEVAKLTSKSY